MTKRIRNVAILLSVVFVALIVASISMTAAVWTSSGGGDVSQSTVGTNAQSVDWNMWAKYFECFDENEYHSIGIEDALGDNQVALGKFFAQGIGLNNGRLIIPKTIERDGVTKVVAVITSQVFADVTLQEMVEELYIPKEIKYIAPGAFAGLVNLKKVVFEADKLPTLGQAAFAGCLSLSKKQVFLNGGGTPAQCDEEVFVGCPD